MTVKELIERNLEMKIGYIKVKAIKGWKRSVTDYQISQNLMYILLKVLNYLIVFTIMKQHVT